MSQKIFSVYDVVHHVKQTLDYDYNLQSIYISGEISNFTNHRSGHWYFTLKDKRSKINCVMFSTYASRCQLRLKEGMQVIAHGSVSMYEAGGSVQLIVTSLQVDGLGNLYLQLEEVKKRMAAEGLFAQERKKTLPLYPMNIGVITAKTGAAVQDVLTTISRRWPIADVKVYPTLVQGISASKDIIKNLTLADAKHHDVILLTRGGGAIEDLWCFNDEAVARCICGMETVVVTGVGHETDTTLVDYVSDARAPTPTGAAELITPDRTDVLEQLHHMRTHMKACMMQRLQEEKTHFHRLQSHRYLQDPQSYIRDSQMKLAMHAQELGIVEKKLQLARKNIDYTSSRMVTLAQQIQHSYATKITRMHLELLHDMTNYKNIQKQYLKQTVQLLDAYSPLKILQRGYAIAQYKDQCITSIDEVQVDQNVDIRLTDGYIHTIIQSKEKL